MGLTKGRGKKRGRTFQERIAVSCRGENEDCMSLAEKRKRTTKGKVWIRSKKYLVLLKMGGGVARGNLSFPSLYLYGEAKGR